MMFSLIIPTYKREKEVLELLESLSNQSYKQFEAIIVNDDPTSKLKIVENKYTYNVTYIQNETNSGPSFSRNRALDHATGDWVVFCDDDDEIYNHKLQRLVDVTVQYPEVNFLVHRGVIKLKNEGLSYKTKNTIPRDLKDILIYNCIGGTPFVAVKRNFLGNLRFDESLKALEDYELWIQLVTKEEFAPFLIEDDLIQCKYVTQQNSVSKNITNNIEAWDVISKKHNILNKLSIKEQKKKKTLFHAMIGYKYLLMYNRIASIHYLKAFFESLNVKFLIISALGMINIRIVFKLR
jgi:glycosyltransferase involved in cell wall biosynthesis